MRCCSRLTPRGSQSTPSPLRLTELACSTVNTLLQPTEPVHNTSQCFTMATAASPPPLKRANSLQKARAKLGRLLTRKKERVPVVEVSPPPPVDQIAIQDEPALASPTSPGALQLPEVENVELVEEVDSSKVSKLSTFLDNWLLTDTDPGCPQADLHLHNESYSLALAAYSALLTKLSPSSPQRPLLRLHKTDCLLNLNKFHLARDEADTALRELRALEAADKAQRRKSSGGEGMWVGGGLERNGSMGRGGTVGRGASGVGRRMSLDGAVGMVRRGSGDWAGSGGGGKWAELERKLKDRREIARKSGGGEQGGVGGRVGPFGRIRPSTQSGQATMP